MVKLFFVLSFFICDYNQKRNLYSYKIENCIGLRDVTSVEYENKRVGILHGVNAGVGFCYGKLEINKQFILTKDMVFYKIKPFIGDVYIKIEKRNDKKDNIKFQVQDTIRILSPNK
jgi:hypothetical protein